MKATVQTLKDAISGLFLNAEIKVEDDNGKEYEVKKIKKDIMRDLMIDLYKIRDQCKKRRMCTSCPYKNKDVLGGCWLSELTKRPSDWKLERMMKGIESNK